MALALKPITGGEVVSVDVRSGLPGARRAALGKMRSMGELGAATMGYHEQAYQSLYDADVSVQVAALRALGAMGVYGAAYGESITGLLRESGDVEVKKAAIQALADFGEEAYVFTEDLEGFLDHQDPELVAEVCKALGSVKATSASWKVEEKLKSPDADVVVGACIGLGWMGCGDTLVSMLDNEEERVRAAAMAALPPETAEKQLKRVVAGLADPAVNVRMAASKLVEALGEKAAPEVAEIARLLDSPSPGPRAVSAAALAAVGAEAEGYIDALEDLLADSAEDTSALAMCAASLQRRPPAVLRKPACAAAAALGKLGSKGILAADISERLSEGLMAEDWEVRAACITALGRCGEAGWRFEDLIAGCFTGASPCQAQAICEALGNLAESTGKPCGPAAIGKMSEMMKSPDPALRAASLGGLARMGEDGVGWLVEDFVKRLGDPVGLVRVQAIATVAACGEMGQMYAAEVCRLMFDEETRVRVAAVSALPEMGIRGAAYTEEVCSLFEDPMPEVRAAAAKAVGAFGGHAAGEYVRFLEALTEEDPSWEVRQAARQAAVKMLALEE